MTASTPRILHVSQPVDAGVAVVLAELAEYQQASGWDVHVACPPDGWLPERLRTSQVTLHRWRAGRAPGPSSVAETRELRSLVRVVRPDLVHLHSAKAGLAGRLALRGTVPTVFQPHAWSFHAAGGIVGTVSTLWERAAMRWTDLVVAVSGGELHEGYRRGISPQRSIVIPNGVDVHDFVPRDREAARRRLGLGPEPLAVCVGRVTRQKGQDLLLSLWPSVRDEVPDARLVVVGDGPLLAELEGHRVDGVAFAGQTIAPQDWYAAADVVVVPSRWEGMALVPLEAMACERPVVGFDVAGLAESIGDAGTVVAAGDGRALAREIVRRLADPAVGLGEGRRGRQRAVTLYDRAQAMSVTDEALRSLLAPGQRRLDPLG